MRPSHRERRTRCTCIWCGSLHVRHASTSSARRRSSSSRRAGRRGSSRRLASRCPRGQRERRPCALSPPAAARPHADVAEPAYAPVSETGDFGHEGSTPSVRTASSTTCLRGSVDRAPGFEPGGRGSTPLGGFPERAARAALSSFYAGVTATSAERRGSSRNAPTAAARQTAAATIHSARGEAPSSKAPAAGPMMNPSCHEKPADAR